MQTLNNIINYLAIGLLLLSFLLTLISSWRFKNIFIKLISLEVLVNVFICGVGVWAVHIDFPVLLDICIALSLIMFLSAVAYCQFLMNRKH